MRMGSDGATIVFTDLRPGDELLIVLVEEAPAGATASPTGTPPMAGASSAGSPSAIPRDVVSATPSEASELMVFRDVQAP
jgi:hypothetical protein